LVLEESILTLLFIAEYGTPKEPYNRTNTLEIGSPEGNVHPESVDLPIYETAPQEVK
jgi:hypothetical protein